MGVTAIVILHGVLDTLTTSIVFILTQHHSSVSFEQPEANPLVPNTLPGILFAGVIASVLTFVSYALLFDLGTRKWECTGVVSSRACDCFGVGRVVGG